MSGKPYRSCLVPYEIEILALRRRRPKCANRRTSFSEVSDQRASRNDLQILKVRARGGRRVYAVNPDDRSTWPTSSGSKSPQIKSGSSPAPEKPIFEFKYSERYNLTRLPEEVAAARRKKLEEQGH